MRENFELSFTHLLQHEGGLTNDKHDDGGLTNLGVTQAEYDAFRRRKGLVPRSVKFVTSEEARELYRQNYWNMVRGDELPAGIDYCTFDAAVNSGPVQGIKWLQRAINEVCGRARLTADGHIGALTMDAVDDYAADKIITAAVAQRLGTMRVMHNDKGVALFPVFGTGWTKRLYGENLGGGKRRPNGVIQYALAMAAQPTLEAAAPPVRKPALPVPVPTKPLSNPPKSPQLPTLAVLAAALLAIIMGVIKWLS